MTTQRKYISRARVVTTLPHPMLEELKARALENQRPVGVEIERLINKGLEHEKEA